tara:strand:+ start:1312 stop:1629 length:318 start_codon:yes stop_codon:yes gene_type:complete
MKYFKAIMIVNILLFVYSCGSIKEGFSNQKKNSSDEFLVEKKSPLVMPPDYEDLPIPVGDEEKLDEIKNEDKIKELLSNKDVSSNKSKDVNINFEESLLKKIEEN